MIVDLERNDLSRVCEPGSVRWPELMATRALAGVEHMVSTVEGTLRDGVGLAELLAATFPGGSITGAPKIAAVDLIAELEPVGRGASMGALGRVYGNGDLDLALTIRTFAIADGRIHLWVGGGVVWDSDPEAEIAESWTKADPLLRAIGAPRPEADERSPASAAAVGGEGAMSGDGAARRRGVGPRPRRPRRAGDRRRRRGVHARPGRLRDDARLRRAAVPARRAPRAARGARRSGSASSRPTAPRSSAWPRSRSRRRALPEAVLRLYWTPGPPGGDHCAIVLVGPIPGWIEEARARGQRLVSLLHPRRSAPWLLPATKSTSYAVNIAAEAEAKARGADDAVFVDGDGIVLEGPVTNIWWREGDVLLTPSLEVGILAGETRAALLELAARSGQWSRRASSRSRGCSRPTRSSPPRRSVR